MTSNFIYDLDSICKIEEKAKTLSTQSLMQLAADAALKAIQCLWPAPRVKNILLVCGGGNNGGDGMLLAVKAKGVGFNVMVLQVGDPQSSVAVQECQKAGVTVQKFSEDFSFNPFDLIVDAICGIGLRGEVSLEVAKIIERINAATQLVLALDIPTGIDATTGKKLGHAIYANATVTFIALKTGLYNADGIAHAGKIILDDLHLPTEIFSEQQASAQIISSETYANLLKPRHKNWHKGLSGHVLIIGGDKSFAGAPRLAAIAALRTGAGLVTVATHKKNYQMMSAQYPEIISCPIETAADLTPCIERATVIVIGPGLGRSPWSMEVLTVALQSALPLVIDADALNLIALDEQPINPLHSSWIITPHPGEAARLLKVSTAQIQADRFAAIKKLRDKFSSIVILKGAATIVMDESSIANICAQGNPGMATAGMGDVLSGIVGSLVAQQIPGHIAAKLAVALHAEAGDLAAKDGERGMIASDLFPHLRKLCNPAH